MVKMIAVWGSPGSGKKTLAAALAFHLAAKERNSVVISTDSSTPALPVFLPHSRITGDGSIGALLSRPMSGYQSLRGYIHLHPQSERVGFMGIAGGESAIEYRAFKREQMMGLLKILNDSPFDYVIFVCHANPVFDPLTQLALQTSEYRLRLVTPDVRGIEFERAQKAWLQGVPEMDVDSHTRIFSPVHRVSPVADVVALSGDSEYRLPFSEDVYSRSAAGAPVIGCRDRFGIQYDKQVGRLAGWIAGA